MPACWTNSAWPLEESGTILARANKTNRERHRALLLRTECTMTGPAVYDRSRFNSRQFDTSGAHVPPGGLGCFSARYVPLTGRMTVTVKVCPRFRSINGGRMPDDVGRNFMRAFELKIPEYWNDRFRFICTKRGFEDIAVTPEFQVVWSSLADAHYDLSIQDYDGMTFVRDVPDRHMAGKPAYRHKPFAQFTTNDIEANTLCKAGKLLEAIRKPVVVAVNTASDQSLLSMAAIERLRFHALDIAHVLIGHPEPRLTITGPGPAGTTFAKLVGNVLMQLGLQAKYSYRSHGPPDIVTLTLDSQQIATASAQIMGNIAQFPQFAQYAVVHEFGHMLGLPDEYMCCGTNTVAIMAQHGMAAQSAAEQSALENNTTTKQQKFSAGIAKTQEEFIKLCALFGVVAPPFGRANQSLMSAGHTFLPAHAVTVAHALWRMTRNYFQPGEWRIELLKS